ncbi:MurR/RpiR family transcriptional regulator [Microbacterium album]|uniref:Transcriptional regulator n=1 Tax=Microbacterium album TaxID=2053191 RepID=A0A917MKV6_9MICO|nr:MurR/RpiR family transcriptional regulator [Microbacterium album]GGH34466.1 transcriptional regulator [Microbacterium album]
MTVGSEESTPAVRIAAVRNELRPAELRIAEALQADPATAVESTAQEFADRLGVARSSVIRTCQKLGYTGWPRLRVALARQIALAAPARPALGDQTGLGAMRAEIDRFAALLPQTLALLAEDVVERVVAALVSARRVLCVANGLSSPLALDLAMRLTAAGRQTDVLQDAFGQQVAARHLGEEDVLVVISGSGANELSLRAAAAARRGGARVIAVTSFASSPLMQHADDALVVASVHESFRDELEYTSRIAHAVLLHALVPLVVERLGPSARAARTSVLEVLGANLSDEHASEDASRG